ENTSSSSSTFCWRSDLDPERSASATHDSMCRPRSSFWTCSSAPCTAEICRRMSTQYASLSSIRCSPCTCPSMRRSRPRALTLVSSLSTFIPPGGSIGSPRRSVKRAEGSLEEGGLGARSRGAAAATAGGRPLLRLPRRSGRRRRRARQLPALLVGDALALLDDEQVDEPRERVAQQTEVALPVAG